MRVLICTLFVFLSACGPQIGIEPTQVEYKITPKDSGFLVEINHNGRYLSKQSYFFTAKPTDPKNPVTYSVFEKGYFQLAGGDFLKCMGVDPSHKKSIRIIWDAPSDWKFASSFPKQTFEANCYDLVDALYVGGNDPTLSIQKTSFGTLVIVGRHDNLNPSDIENALLYNMNRVHKFWKSSPAPYHLVSIRGFNSKKASGSAHFQSFQLDLPKNQEAGRELDHLITHEYFHDWNPKKYNVPRASDHIEHVDILWFTEGFTDYFAYWLVYQESPSKYLETFQTDNFRNIYMSELKRNYKNNRTYFFVPYIQGRRIAADFDKKIKNHSGKRLADVMFELAERSKNPNFILTKDNIFKVICEGNYMPCDHAPRIYQTYVIDGQQLTPVTNPLT